MTTNDPTESLVRRAQSASFMEIVYELERRLSPAAPIGGAGPVSAEAVRFRHDPSLAFSTSDISDARVSADDVVELTTTFLGVTGAASPLPPYFAEEVLQEDPEAPVRRDFLDMFHHRLLGLLYRGLSSLRYPETFQAGGRDPLSLRLLSLCGFDLYEAASESYVPNELLLRLAPVLLIHGPTLEALHVALRIVLEDVVEDAELGVRTLTGKHLPVAPEDRMRLGVNSYLGARTAPPVGDSIACPSSAIEVQIGPLSLEAYRRMRSPEQLALLRTIIAVVTSQCLDCTLVLTLREGAAPPWRLSSAEPAQLGTDSWLASATGARAARTQVHLPA